MSASEPELWIPGPTHVRPELLARCAEPMFGHRAPRMVELLRGLEHPLRLGFGAHPDSHAVAVHSCTASGLMEMGLRAVGEGARAPRVLACVHGSFSERFARVAESVGSQVVRVESPIGACADLSAAQRVLRDEGPFDAILACLSETSTGVMNDPADVGRAFAERGSAALLVDAVTYFGAAPIDASKNGLDLVISGTQKALALPPGLGPYCVSERLLHSAQRRPGRGYFMDLIEMTRAHGRGAPPMTPTIPLFVALAEQLATISAGKLELELTDEPAAALEGLDGWGRRYRRHGRMRAIVREWLASQGLTTFGDAHGGVTSPTVTCVHLPAHDVDGILRDMAAAGYTLAPGYGVTRATSLRIGHMGDHSVGALRRLLERLGQALARHAS